MIIGTAIVLAQDEVMSDYVYCCLDVTGILSLHHTQFYLIAASESVLYTEVSFLYSECPLSEVPLTVHTLLHPIYPHKLKSL